MGFRGAQRGQILQIGAVVLFAFLILALAAHQAFVVPQQNARVEYDHSQAVESDMLSARNALMRAASTGAEDFTEVTLGTSYPTRVFAVNPAPVSGTLRTTDPKPVTVIEDRTGSATNVTGSVCPGTAETRALRYEGSYNEYSAAPALGVENTVAYREFSHRTLLDSQQRLVSGETVSLVLLRGAFSASGDDIATVEPRAGPMQTTTVEDPELRLPTRLNETLWEEALAGEVAPGNVSVDGDVLTVGLSGSYTVECTSVGVNQVPPEGQREEQTTVVSNGNGDINPAGEDAVIITDLKTKDAGRNVTVTFENKGSSDAKFARARVPFLLERPDQKPVEKVYIENNNKDELVVWADYQQVDSTVVIPGGKKKEVVFGFKRNVKNSLVGINVIYDDGTKSTYFIDVPGDTTKNK